MLTSIISFIIVLGPLVILHELGHFIIARRNGVKVEKFSIGFGPKLFSKSVGGTEYKVSLIPLGGYVKMSGENADEMHNSPDDFSSKNIWQRTKIVFAGPFMNIFLAFALMPLAYLAGTEVPRSLGNPAIIGWVDENSPAEKAGFQIGDEIKSIYTETPTWKDVLDQVSQKSASGFDITIQRGTENKVVHIDSNGPVISGWSVAGLYPQTFPVVKKVLPGYPAEQAGLMASDKIVSLNGIPVTQLNRLLYLSKVNQGKEVQLVINRDGSLITKALTPVLDEKSQKVVIGISMGPETVLKKYGVMEAFQKGIARTWELTELTFHVLGQLVTGQLSLNSLGGPISIAQSTGQAAQVGIGALLSLTAFLSLQLGIMNLLPIPLLDGGWLLFFGLEAIIGRPVNQKIIQYGQAVGLAMLAGLMVLVTFKDIEKLFK